MEWKKLTVPPSGGSPSVIPRLAASASPVNSFEMQNPGPHRRPHESEILERVPQTSVTVSSVGSCSSLRTIALHEWNVFGTC